MHTSNFIDGRLHSLIGPVIYVTEYSKQCLAEEQRTCILLSKSSTVWKSVIMSLIMSRARTRAATFAAEWPWFSSPASSMFLWRAGKNYEAGTVYFWLVFCWNCSFCHWNYIIIWHDVHFVLCLEFYFNIYFNKVLAKYCMLHFLTTLPKSKMFGCIAKQAGVNWVYLSQSKPHALGSPLLRVSHTTIRESITDPTRLRPAHFSAPYLHPQ